MARDIFWIKTNFPGDVADLSTVGSGALVVPQGTTAQRPATVLSGMIRFNTTNGKLEYNDGTSWLEIVDAVPGSPPVSTVASVGAGASLISSFTGGNLQLKSLVAGSGVSITQTATEITISSSLGGSFLPLSGGTMTGPIDMGGNNITNAVTIIGNTIRANTQFEGNVFKATSGADFVFRDQFSNAIANLTAAGDLSIIGTYFGNANFVGKTVTFSIGQIQGDRVTTATTGTVGVVRKATNAELTAVTPPIDVYPDVAGVRTMISTFGSSPISLSDEGIVQTTAVTALDFVGNGVVATAVGGAGTITIPGVSQTTARAGGNWMIGDLVRVAQPGGVDEAVPLETAIDTLIQNSTTIQNTINGSVDSIADNPQRTVTPFYQAGDLIAVAQPGQPDEAVTFADILAETIATENIVQQQINNFTSTAPDVYTWRYVATSGTFNDIHYGASSIVFDPNVIATLVPFPPIIPATQTDNFSSAISLPVGQYLIETYALCNEPINNVTLPGVSVMHYDSTANTVTNVSPNTTGTFHKHNNAGFSINVGFVTITNSLDAIFCKVTRIAGNGFQMYDAAIKIWRVG